uniref:Ankyrin repeat domain 2 (stretch responsive muscle) n=1 Tax=Salarias fasciatus TaxID=181472 RepID=A0A672IHG5_SALFA
MRAFYQRCNFRIDLIGLKDQTVACIFFVIPLCLYPSESRFILILTMIPDCHHLIIRLFTWCIFLKLFYKESVRSISSDLLCEILGLREKIKKAYPPRVSEEIPIASANMSEFMNAASQGKVEVIHKYLSDGGNPNAHDELKRTALHRAALEGHTDILTLLIGWEPPTVFQLGSRAIHWACRGGSLGVVEALKSHGADLNARDKLCSTPLHVATRTGHTAIVEYLLSCGAKINSRDREGDTALHDAVRLNRYKIVELLIASGADTKIKNHVSLPDALYSTSCLASV